MSLTLEKSIREKARVEYNQLRNDDEVFANQWDNNEKDFEEWFEDIYMPSIDL